MESTLLLDIKVNESSKITRHTEEQTKLEIIETGIGGIISANDRPRGSFAKVTRILERRIRCDRHESCNRSRQTDRQTDEGRDSSGPEFRASRHTRKIDESSTRGSRGHPVVDSSMAHVAHRREEGQGGLQKGR